MTPPKPAAPELPVLHFEDQAAFAEWLDRHHPDAPGAWLRHAKKDGGLRSVSYAEALDVALCYGWIDSQKKSWDEASWIQKWSPRGPRSIWSRVNRDKVEALLAAGRMKPAGLAAVEAARADGRWDAAYESQSRATVPEDLQAALDASPRAAAFFATLNGANRYAILFRVQTAKKPETRAKRIAGFIEMLERGDTVHG